MADTATSPAGSGAVSYRRLADLLLGITILIGGGWAAFMHKSMIDTGERMVRVEEQCKALPRLEQKIDKLSEEVKKP